MDKSINSSTLSTLKGNKIILNIINISLILLFIVIVIVIYYFFIKIDKFTEIENFKIENKNNKINKLENDLISDRYYKSIYEFSLENVYYGRKQLLCNMIPILSSIKCSDINGNPLKKDKFPVHLMKNPDGKIIAVFNDGYLYQKTSMKTGLWQGPLENSLIMGLIPLRMITISPNGTEYLGVGYDNKLYKKISTSNQLDISSKWQPVENNENIIYVLTDPITNKLIGISTTGKLMIKEYRNINSKFVQLDNLTINILKAFFDNNGYMLVLDTNFNLWQIKDKEWMNSNINLEKKNNPTRVNDILYDNDGKLFGLIFTSKGDKLQIMKQTGVYFLSSFIPLNLQILSNNDDINYVMNDNSIIIAKCGVDYQKTEARENIYDDDTNYAYIRTELDNKRKLRNFCSNIKQEYDPNHLENYELLSDIEANEVRIKELNRIINQLKKF